MFSRLKFLALLVFVVDLILLGVLVHYTSWLFVLGFVFISGVIGVWLLNDGLRLYMRKSGRAINENEMPVDHFLVGAVAHLAAGVLFIVPGVLTDLMALLLLTPARTWLARFFITSLFGKIFPHFSNQNSSVHSSGEKPAKDEIIDVRVISSDGNEPKNGR
jgi:UPF0716 family protein affecting phage T7 exclusion